MSGNEQEAKTKENNDNVLRAFIDAHMDRSYEKISISDILKSRPHEKIDRDKRIAIAKRIQRKLEEDGELDDLHFKAAATAGLVEVEHEP